MISNAVWQEAIARIRADAENFLSVRCDIDEVKAALDELADEKPPRINDMGDPFMMARVQVTRRLQDRGTSQAIQSWLDEFTLELVTPPFQNE